MTTPLPILVLSADRLTDDSLVIAFSDGSIGLYTAELLHSILAQTEPLPPLEDDWDDSDAVN